MTEIIFIHKLKVYNYSKQKSNWGKSKEIELWFDSEIDDTHCDSHCVCLHANLGKKIIKFDSFEFIDGKFIFTYKDFILGMKKDEDFYTEYENIASHNKKTVDQNFKEIEELCKEIDEDELEGVSDKKKREIKMFSQMSFEELRDFADLQGHSVTNRTRSELIRLLTRG